MRILLGAALFGALALSTGCSLTLDPDSVAPPAKPPPITPRGACVSAEAGRQLCGGQITGGAGDVAATHRIVGGQVGTPSPNVSSAEHRIVRGDVSP